MDTVIVGENEELIGLSVIDDDGVEHVIDVRKDDGTVRTHNQDGYPEDPSEREHWENENVSQARRHGLYYAYRERGVETLPPHENPDRLAAVLLAQVSLDEAEFERLFGDLYRRVDDDDYGDLAPSVDPDDFRMCQQDVYVEGPLEAIADRLEEWLGEPLADCGDDDTPVPLADMVTEALGPGRWADEGPVGDRKLASVATFEAVSEVYLTYYEVFNELATTPVEDRLDREPDAELQLSSLTFETLGEFHSFLAVHTRAQVRDCFLGMGVEPPAFYRVLGPGRWEFMQKYRHLDVYEEYYDVAANIPGYHYPMAD